MTVTKEDDKIASQGGEVSYEPEIVATAVPAGVSATGGGTEAPVPAGHARFYCNKCHTVRFSCRAYDKRTKKGTRGGLSRGISLFLCCLHLFHLLACQFASKLIQSIFSRTTCLTRPHRGGARTAWNSIPSPRASALGAPSSRW